ncbi:conserved Plasmodium protein, unknown function [Plasmodium gallinaceum]|uniref:MORN repeat protein n=1 Tax=Plasmodium gallinaceum TaxID=5849 RepID=A0A1J1GT12_PLAGA|nr:conserved Plasmodium protein, unknown function [Plasmodium gallinaceum]CRG95422.1 conserved Plasmodium protein, unknown function [Plasmodium gallinaceum]
MIEFLGEKEVCKSFERNYSGEANVKYKNGDKFVGTFENGEKKKGKYYYSNKSIYEGFYLNGKKSGLGKLIKSENEFYYGNFENGKKKGIGFQKYPNGDFYYGEWINNKKNGKGIYYFYSTKEYYFGEWCKGNFISGEWQISNELKYIGKYFKNKPKCVGYFLFSNELKINVFFKQLLSISNINKNKEENIELKWNYIN